MGAPGPEFTVLAEKSDEYLFVAHRNVNIVVWSGESSVDGLELMNRAVVETIRAFPEGLSAVHVVTETAKLPGPRVRDEFSKQVEMFGKSIPTVSLVVDRDGFFASALRSALTGILMLTKAKLTVRVHGSIAESCAWLVPVHAAGTGVDIHRADLQAVMENACRMHREKTPARPMPVSI